MCIIYLALWDDKKHLVLSSNFLFSLSRHHNTAFADVRVELLFKQAPDDFLSAFWIVLIVNVFNFLDNMDVPVRNCCYRLSYLFTVQLQAASLCRGLA